MQQQQQLQHHLTQQLKQHRLLQQHRHLRRESPSPSTSPNRRATSPNASPSMSSSTLNSEREHDPNVVLQRYAQKTMRDLLGIYGLGAEGEEKEGGGGRENGNPALGASDGLLASALGASAEPTAILQSLIAKKLLERSNSRSLEEENPSKEVRSREEQ